MNNTLILHKPANHPRSAQSVEYYLDMVEIVAPSAGSHLATGAEISTISREYCRFYGDFRYFIIGADQGHYKCRADWVPRVTSHQAKSEMPNYSFKRVSFTNCFFF